ncbi:MAG TPA: hypothetical protein VGF40_13485, partial [Thermoanaerobaculia bacterium]
MAKRTKPSPVALPVLAVDLGGTKVAVALVDPRGRVLSRADEPVDTATPNGPVDQIVRMARAMRSERDFAAA